MGFRIGPGLPASGKFVKSGPFLRRKRVSGIEDEHRAISEIEFGGLPGWFVAGLSLGGWEFHGVAPAPVRGNVERLHGVEVEGRTRGRREGDDPLMSPPLHPSGCLATVCLCVTPVPRVHGGGGRIECPRAGIPSGSPFGFRSMHVPSWKVTRVPFAGYSISLPRSRVPATFMVPLQQGQRSGCSPQIPRMRKVGWDGKPREARRARVPWSSYLVFFSRPSKAMTSPRSAWPIRWKRISSIARLPGRLPVSSWSISAAMSAP